MMKKRVVFFALCAVGVCVAFAACQDTRGDKTMRARDLYGDSPFGVLEFPHWNHAWNNYKYPDTASLERVAQAMQEAGVGILRMDFLWGEIEPKEGEFEFSKYDAIVDIMARHGIKILGLLHYSANWASESGQWNDPPRDNQLFVNYAVKVIGRYRDKIKYWEVWNEPDSSTYWFSQDGLKRYCTLLRDVYQAAKLVDPDCKILNGGFAQGSLSVNRLYDNGAKGFFDILNIHIFESPLDGLALKRAQAYIRLAAKIMKRNGDGDKKIWITEVGCPGVKKGARVNNWWMGKNPDEKTQAAWVTTVFTELITMEPVEKVFWAFFRDCKGHWDNGVDYFGLIRWDYSQKPSFEAYRTAFELWKKRKK